MEHEDDGWTDMRPTTATRLLELVEAMREEIRALRGEVRQLDGRLRQHTLLTMPVFLDSAELSKERAVNMAIRQKTPFPVARVTRP